MENTNNVGIVNSWSLLAFAKSHGAMKVVPPTTKVNSHTGEEFTSGSCAFVHPTEKDENGRAKVCFVGFSSKLGELTPEEISARKNDLQVVELQTGSYYLCSQGESSWADVSLF
jgi:hypothetical protein